MKPSDQELLSRIATRDAEAFATLYDRYAASVHGLIRRFVPSADSSDDLLQEVFWQAWERASRYDPARGEVKTWLFLLARSRALDYRRRNAIGSGAVPARDVDGEVAVEPESGMEIAESRMRLTGAMADLPPEQAEVLMLAFYEGLTHVQIAERLGLALGTVKTRIRSGIIRLRNQLGSLSDTLT
ncbi:MAG: sigma-70 family RNA polymerase sigma factor [Isosphaeraceae bacterium]